MFARPWHSSRAPPFDVGEEDQGKKSGFTLIEEQLLLSERLPEAILGMRFKLWSGFGNSGDVLHKRPAGALSLSLPCGIVHF